MVLIKIILSGYQLVKNLVRQGKPYFLFKKSIQNQGVINNLQLGAKSSLPITVRSNQQSTILKNQV